MTALTRNPSNPNPLQPNKFLLTFGRVPNMQYFCQNVTVPGLSLSEAVITNPFVDIYSPGEKAIYDLLNVTFIIDEELKGWLEIHDWIRAMTFPVEFKEYRNLSKLNKKVIEWDATEFTYKGKTYAYRDMKDGTGKLYDLDSFKRSQLVPGVEPVLLGSVELVKGKYVVHI